jgi:hypothetical protein
VLGEETTVIEEQPQKMTLNDLKKYDGTLYVQNMGPTMFRCHDKRGNKWEVDFELGPAGSDEDICVLPTEALEIQHFRRALAKGIVSISSDPDMEEKIDLNIQQSVDEDTRRRNALIAQTDEPLNRKDLVSKTCVVCSTLTFQAMREVAIGVPPTCPLHHNEKENYTGTQTGIDPVGQAIWVFTRRPGV